MSDARIVMPQLQRSLEWADISGDAPERLNRRSLPDSLHAPRPPVLLTSAGYSGTLAAARCLGGMGVDVTVADWERLAPAMWSRYITRRVRAPRILQVGAYLDWLLDFGTHNPGHVLYPTSDDMAWLLAEHRDILRSSYYLYSPPIRTLRSLLDKRSLVHVCQEIGIPTLDSWFPSNIQELQFVASDIEYPVLIKPLTQAFLPYNHKGSVVYSRKELVSKYVNVKRGLSYERSFVQRNPCMAWPMIQRYLAGAAQSIYSLTGFVSDTGDIWDFRASRKILQYPRRLGIGICFEERAVVPELAKQLLDLCKHVGYYGLFEVEFVEVDGRFMLIDFNPRFYSQMWFEIMRGMPLPAYVYYGATNSRTLLHDAVERSRQQEAEGHNDRVLVNSFMFFLTLAGQGAGSAMPMEEVKRWWQWYWRHGGRRFDLMAARDDRVPAMVDGLTRTVYYLKHPRYAISALCGRTR